MNKIISEGIEAAGEAAKKVKEYKDQNSVCFPYKTALIALGIGAILGCILASANPPKKKN